MKGVGQRARFCSRREALTRPYSPAGHDSRHGSRRSGCIFTRPTHALCTRRITNALGPPVGVHKAPSRSAVHLSFMFIYRHQGRAYCEPSRSGDKGVRVSLTQDQVAAIPWDDLIVDSCSHSAICLRMQCVEDEFLEAHPQVSFLRRSAGTRCEPRNRLYLRRNQAFELAVMSGLHPRMGSESPFRMLDDALIRSILELKCPT